LHNSWQRRSSQLTLRQFAASFSDVTRLRGLEALHFVSVERISDSGKGAYTSRSPTHRCSQTHVQRVASSHLSRLRSCWMTRGVLRRSLKGLSLL